MKVEKVIWEFSKEFQLVSRTTKIVTRNDLFFIEYNGVKLEFIPFLLEVSEQDPDIVIVHLREWDSRGLRISRNLEIRDFIGMDIQRADISR